MRTVLLAAIFALIVGPALATEAPAVQLDMPPGMPAPPSDHPCHTVVVRLDVAGAATVNGKPVTRAQLGKSVADLTKVSNNCERVMIWPNVDTPYGEALMVISLLKQAGIRRIWLMSEDVP